MFPFIPLYTILDAQTKSDGFHFFLLENSSFHNSYNWWVEILFANFMSLSEVAQSCPTLCDPWTVAHQAPPSMGFSRQEYWSGLPFQIQVYSQYWNKWIRWKGWSKISKSKGRKQISKWKGKMPKLIYKVERREISEGLLHSKKLSLKNL